MPTPELDSHSGFICEYIYQIYQVVHNVQFIICQLNLNKAIILRNRGKKNKVPRSDCLVIHNYPSHPLRCLYLHFIYM